jgi:hypothetical protein
MRFIHLAIVLGLVTASACAKKQAAVPTNPTSNTTPAPADPAKPGDTATPAPDAAKSESRGPVKKGGDPCEGGQ